MRRDLLRVFLLLFLLSPIVLTFSCSVGSEPSSSECDSKVHDFMIIDDRNEWSAMGQSYRTDFANEGEASVQWRMEGTDVCTGEHVDVNFTLRIDKDYDSQVTIEAWSNYLGYCRDIEPERTLDGNNWQYHGDDNFGLKHAYGSGKGEFSFHVIMHFPSTGYWDTDSLFVEDAITYLYRSADYWH